ncbi:hypothetical protein GCM10027413_11410 [Conyzicola nivalis]|uniref:Uncharacterized protein n=1 Tax=Conyzicola nivalis TaxID=1477021 RepID=A0A916WIR4_9MICO|nr:hypothetical protein [Conyzicola nivalis]GGB01617.1 hypothetical protein GCM10010979_15220 [Conyzicola nivalis]
MKTLWFVSLVVITAGLTVGGALIITMQSTGEPGAAYWLAIAALTIFVCGPVCLAAVAFYWDVRSGDARRYFRHYLRVVLVLEGLASVAIVAYAMLEGVAVWLPLLFIGVGGAVTGLVVLASPRIAAKYRKPEVPVVWAPVTRAETVRGVRLIAFWFFGTLVVLSVGLAFALPDEPVQQIFVALQLAFTAGAVAGAFVSASLARRLGAITGRDVKLASTIMRVVVRGKAVDLDDEETVAAAKYAEVWKTVQGFQLAFLGLLFSSTAVLQLGSLIDGSVSGMSIAILVVLAAAAVILGPIMVAQIRRARRYAREHAHRLPVAAEAGYDREQSPRR